jgi:hypothetical protein
MPSSPLTHFCYTFFSQEEVRRCHDNDDVDVAAVVAVAVSVCITTYVTAVFAAAAIEVVERR